jgi:hypothetical protein
LVLITPEAARQAIIYTELIPLPKAEIAEMLSLRKQFGIIIKMPITGSQLE